MSWTISSAPYPRIRIESPRDCLWHFDGDHFMRRRAAALVGAFCRSLLAILAGLLALVASACLTDGVRANDRDALDVIAKGYSANIEAFPRFVCKFTSIEHQSKT